MVVVVVVVLDRSRSQRVELVVGLAEVPDPQAEDHDELRAYSSGILRELGYNVLTAASGMEAIATLEDNPGVALLFTDVVLPGGMNGRQIADEALRRRPDLKVLFTTGYTRNAIVHNGMLDANVAFLPKPFTLEQLSVKVRQVIDGQGANRPA